MLIVIAGPTGTGKSALSLELAARYEAAGRAAEIVNADSMQQYRGMDIGTAKLDPGSRARFPHHQFDVLDVTETASVADYQQRARQTITQIQERGAVPILVGGTGLYIAAVIHDLQFPVRDDTVRQALEAELAQSGPGMLWRRLQQLDPEAAASIDARNGRRVARALEVVTLTGRPFSASLPSDPVPWQETVQFFLDGDRAILRERVARRSAQMFRDGLLDEVAGLIPLGLDRGVTARQAIGYAQALAVLGGELDVAQAVDETIRLTQRYVRRQRSWFARYDQMHRLDFADERVAHTAFELSGE
ncbi:tRNA (adenosine(37)-N6)-dimethylallyltransferase MiaA [Homoserinimonas sp. OAct 916]|uniref:tRNA (adenosine(37)-N6)-dimethylallyltransferase MiaA n=1 Tax=Homoserinimonas sp. OAct 916 TaxID=2211450 RepID=UPI000DBE6A67|nr:tRNA (adenosine(37)-N6)-dimethylallyltransferase MiaA [Homoserinimonas sp. OAct 916]